MIDNKHPITPPPELVKEWMAEIWHEGTPVRVAASDLHIATATAHCAHCAAHATRAAAWQQFNPYGLLEKLIAVN